MRSSSESADGRAVDHLADVVVKLDQVDENWPLNLQQEILLVVLELGMQTIDDSLAVGLGAKLALESRIARRRCGGPGPRPAQRRRRASTVRLTTMPALCLTQAAEGAGAGAAEGRSSCARPSSTSRPWSSSRTKSVPSAGGILVGAAALPRGACTLIGLGHRRSLELRKLSLSIRAGRSDVKLFFCPGRLNPGLTHTRLISPHLEETCHEASSLPLHPDCAAPRSREVRSLSRRRISRPTRRWGQNRPRERWSFLVVSRFPAGSAATANLRPSWPVADGIMTVKAVIS